MSGGVREGSRRWDGHFLAQRKCAGWEGCPRTGWQGRLVAPEEARKMEEGAADARAGGTGDWHECRRRPVVV
jgi:hypothetical protein